MIEKLGERSTRLSVAFFDSVFSAGRSLEGELPPIRRIYWKKGIFFPPKKLLFWGPTSIIRLKSELKVSTRCGLHECMLHAAAEGDGKQFPGRCTFPANYSWKVVKRGIETFSTGNPSSQVSIGTVQSLLEPWDEIWSPPLVSLTGETDVFVGWQIWAVFGNWTSTFDRSKSGRLIRLSFGSAAVARVNQRHYSYSATKDKRFWKSTIQHLNVFLPSPYRSLNFYNFKNSPPNYHGLITNYPSKCSIFGMDRFVFRISVWKCCVVRRECFVCILKKINQ